MAVAPDLRAASVLKDTNSRGLLRPDEDNRAPARSWRAGMATLQLRVKFFGDRVGAIVENRPKDAHVGRIELGLQRLGHVPSRAVGLQHHYHAVGHLAGGDRRTCVAQGWRLEQKIVGLAP